MSKIGFQNFRRFILLSPIEYKGVTFLVGRNNAGKSTLAKALLLINDYLKSGNISNFSFGNKILEDANIVTYGRARNRKSAEDFIKFYYEIANYSIEVTISGENDKTLAIVHSLFISDLSKGIDFLFEPRSQHITISKKRIINTEAESSTTDNLEFLQVELKRLKEAVEKSELKKSSKEYISLIEELNSVEKKRNLLLQSNEPKKSENLYSIATEYDNNWDFKEVIDFAISEAKFLHDREFSAIQTGKTPSKNFENYRGFKEDASVIEKSFERLYTHIIYSSIIYLGANPAKQSALFSIRDINNALAQSIHDFYQLRISKGETEYNFVERWMKEFEVGDSFEIFIRAGEAYEVEISSNGAKIHLADKGMGSIQAMLLLLRLACVIRKRSNRKAVKIDTGNAFDYGVVFIEEPELNLHPALQSKLSDLFLEVNQQYQLDFIIETHSEYILRRSQVLVAERQFESPPNENPFCVYYFPKEIDQQPYRLEYHEDGVFSRNFGNGFFDEASLSTLQLLRIKRRNDS